MNMEDNAMWMDMKFHKKHALLREENTKDTEKLCKRAFFTHAKGGVGTKK